jgi:hypothetical protein
MRITSVVICLLTTLSSLPSGAFAAAKSEKGLVDMSLSGSVVSQCMIPDHNMGKWGCEEIQPNFSITAKHASMIVVVNQSAPNSMYDVITDISRGQIALLNMIDARSPMPLHVPMVNGQNEIRFDLYEGRTLIGSDVVKVQVDQQNRY